MPSKVTTGVGGALAVGSLVNQLRPRGALDEPNTFANTLAGLGGLGTAAYGLAGNNLHNILPTLKNIFGGKPLPTTTTTMGTATNQQDPRLSKFMNPDGTLKFHDLVKAPDEELSGAVALLSPEQRGQMKNQRQTFKPSMAQRWGARAMGIDVEGQKQRFAKLLGE